MTTPIALLAPQDNDDLLAIMEMTRNEIEKMRLYPDAEKRKEQLELDLEEDREVMARLERERGPDVDRDHEQEDEHER
ncbi:hypothetical protein [Palleronia caenipelagi]|uniref:Uncharacterized protein n=1 Tax=Palleronia caenipelagi TaxID=2489174 RepID=A0A547PUA7_9RHOB|nr:hypothetical protein [Palleronia caenipelagi]TRD17726.1 hypothetical protein FEV53_12665 [Palleronia caenipelagi]